MATTIESVDQQKQRLGKKFSFYYIKKAAGNGEVIDIVLSVGSKPIEIDRLILKGNSSIVKFQWFRGATVDIETGLNVYEIPLNETVEKTSGARLLINPDTTGSWTAVLDPVFIYGMAASFDRVKMYEEIISRKIAFKAYSTNMMRVINDDGTSPDIELLINHEVM